MKKKLTSKSFFFKLRVSTAAVFLLTGIAAVLLAVITADPVVGNVDFVAGGGSTTPTPTPTCSWLTGQDLPSVGARFGALYREIFHHSRNPIGGLAALAEPTPRPSLGKFYVMGGRSSEHSWERFHAPVRV